MSMTRAPTAQTCWRVFCTGISLAGGFLLALLLISLADGTLPRELFPDKPPTWTWASAALVLSLPVPFHVLAIGLFLQRRHLSQAWQRIAWTGIMGSGLWLGGAVMVKALLLH